jgi:hypothetical protein
MSLRLLTTIVLLASALLHLLPALGVLGASRLAALYGAVYDEPNTLLLLRHRAVLFGLLALACGVAAFRPAWQTPVLLAALVSTASFVLLAVGAGPLNALVQRVVVIDIVAAVLLGLALLLRAGFAGAGAR